jgi:transcriptional regulator with XRE-family HTH domain
MEHLKKYRAAHKVTQSEMAERLGVRQSTISRIENGELPSLALAARIQAATDDVVKASSWITEGPVQ